MKKLFIVNSDLYVRNYIEAGALESINDSNLYFACQERVFDKNSVMRYGQYVGTIRVTPAQERMFRFNFFLLLHSLRRRSTGFLFRIKREYPHIYYWRRERPRVRVWKKDSAFWALKLLEAPFRSAYNVFLAFVHFAWQNGQKTFELGRIACLSMLRLTGPYLALQHAMRPLNKDLLRLVSEIKPEIILFPCSAADVLGHELLRLRASTASFKLVFLVDNWDNMSSKANFPIRNPDFLFLWGEQSLSFARDIHRIPEKQIRIIGSARYTFYENALKESDRKQRSRGVDFPYVLYAGSAVIASDLEALEILQQFLLCAESRVPRDTRILYRPHPWGAKEELVRQVLENPNFESIVIDPQIREAIERQLDGGQFQPGLDYYPALLQDCEFVVTPLSSMVIEASIMRKKVLALAHDDGALASPENMLRHSPHLHGIQDLGNVLIVHDLEGVLAAAKRLLDEDFSVNASVLERFVHLSNTPYSERLAYFIEQVVQD